MMGLRGLMGRLRKLELRNEKLASLAGLMH